jgi:hypothetical protein
VELSPSSLATADVPQHWLPSLYYWRTNQMNKALIVYLIDRKKKMARQDNESKHAIKELKKQPTVTF